MTTYGNAGDNANILTDTTGGTALTGTDIVNILQGSVNYSATPGALGTTSFAEFNTGPGYSGNLGAYPAGLLVNAATIRLGDSGRRHAIKCTPAHTVDLLEWKNRVGGELMLEEIDEVTAAMLNAAGKVVAQATAKLVDIKAVAPGLSVFLFEDENTPVDAVSTLRVGAGGGRGIAAVYSDRRITAGTVDQAGLLVAREVCAPATLTVSGEYRHESAGALATINAGAGARIDFSKALDDSSSITWNIDGDCTIVEPPAGVTIDLPTSLEAAGYRVRVEPGV
jgi:hypothetical protein